MIRYILVDDDPLVLKRVKLKIDAIAKDYELRHIASYDSSKKAYESINETDYDLLIVDFEMPVYNGIQLAQKVANGKKIIFLTSTSNNEKRIINSLDISGYLSKPFEIEEFEELLKYKVIGKIKERLIYKKGELLTLEISTNQSIGIYPEDIYFISSALISTGKTQFKTELVKTEKPTKNTVNFYGKDSVVQFDNIRVSINDLSTRLHSFGFAKISQSTIVNMNRIKKMNTRELRLYDCEEEFVVSEKEMEGFIEAFTRRF